MVYLRRPSKHFAQNDSGVRILAMFCVSRSVRVIRYGHIYSVCIVYAALSPSSSCDNMSLLCSDSAHEHDPSQCVIVNNLNTTLCLNQNVFCEQLAIFYWGIACVGVKVIDHWALTVVMTYCCVCGSNLFSPTNHKQMELCRVLQKLLAGSKQKWLIVLVDDNTEKSRYCCDQPSVHFE